jgi:hypothetical protein
MDNVVEVIRDYRVGMSTLMLRAKEAEKLLPEKPPSFYMIEDVDIVTRMLAGGFLAPIPSALSVYRVHGTNYSGQLDPVRDEIETWITNLNNIGLSERERVLLTLWGQTQILNFSYRSAVMAGSRRRAFSQCLHMKPSISQVKRILALGLPMKFVQALVQ